MTNKNIIYRPATSEDKESILAFIRVNYYPEEPITIGNEPRVQSAEDEEFSLSTIHYGTTVVAIDQCQNGKLVGVLISSPIEPGDAEQMVEESAQCQSKKWSQILLLLSHLEKVANVCERYNVPKALHIHVMGVDRQLRGNSIGINLMRKCMQIGKMLGYRIASVDCTSVFSIRIAEKLEMECIGVLAYKDYKDENGEQLFRPPPPHTHIKTFVKLL